MPSNEYSADFKNYIIKDETDTGECGYCQKKLVVGQEVFSSPKEHYFCDYKCYAPQKF